MRRRLRYRLLQACALLGVTLLGLWGYRRVVRPEPDLLALLAEEKLQGIFGLGVEYDDFEIDLVEGVEIRGLRVLTPRSPQPTLEARRVRVRHDILALASGLYRPEAIVIEGARIVARETEGGIALDFPFRLESDASTGAFPAIRLRESELFCRAMEGSTRLGAGTVLHLGHIDLDARPTRDGRVDLVGRLSPLGLGQDDVRIGVQGMAEPDADVLELQVVWDPLTLTEPLLAALAEAVSSPLRGQLGQEGQLIVALVRRPDEQEGEVQVRVRWLGEVRVDLSQLPSGEFIDATSREQIDRLFQRAHLYVELEGETINLRGLLKALGGGQVKVDGFIRDDGEQIDLAVQIKGLRLESPDVRDSFHEGGREIFEAFDPGGMVDADVVLSKEPGQPIEWSVDAILEQASFRYVGTPAADGSPEGFPYPVEHAAGGVHIERGEVWFDEVVGFNGPDTTVRIRSPWQEAWTGGETGRIRFGEGTPDIRVTIDATNVKTDEDLRTAVAGSEFSDLFDHFYAEGVLDRIEIDVIAIPGRDEKAYAEVRITLDDERFRYARFPLPLERVKGWVTLRRPFVGPRQRGQIFAFEVSGRAGESPVDLRATYDAYHERGRLFVEARGIGLAGTLADVVAESEITQGAIADAWRWLDPRGRADVTIEVPLENEPGEVKLEAILRGASIRLDAESATAPIEITDLRGSIRVEDDVVHLEDLRGRMLDAAVTLAGTIHGGPEGRWDIHVETDVLRVTPELLANLERLAEEPLLPEGLELGAGARLAVELHLQRDAGPDKPLRVEVVATGLDGVLHLPEGSALAIRASRIVVRGEEVALEGVRGEAPGIRIALDTAHVSTGGIAGRVTLVLEEMEPTPQVLDLLPAEARDVLADLVSGRRISSDSLTIDAKADGSLRFEGDLVLLAPRGDAQGDAARGRIEFRPLQLSAADATDHRTLTGRVLFRGFTFGGDVPVEDLDGEVRLEALRLGDDPSGRGTLRIEEGRLFDLTVRDATIPIRWQGGILRADPLTGTIAEGRLRGRLMLHTREPTAYEGYARIEAFRVEALREDLAPTGPPLSGLGSAWIEFQNRSGETRDLRARGALSVRDGNLGDLPVAANIFAFFAEVLAVDPPPRFERADAVFTIADEVITFGRLDLAGPLFDMPGRGTVDLGGYADLVFTPDFIKSFLLPGVMQFPVVGDVLDAILREDVLYAVRLRGDLSDAEPEIVALPPLGLGADRPFEGTGTPQPPPRRLPRWFR